MEIPWQDVTYLRHGNERQRAAHGALESLKMFDVLRDYTPVLVGTIPLAIDVDESDLDVVCEARDLAAFAERVTQAFGQCKGFRIKGKAVKGVESLVASFFHLGFRIEVFAQATPVMQQHAYRHMVVQARLLAIGGEPARRKIQRLKRAGLKTEPAFACFYHLKGDPYEMLLRWYRLSESELRQHVLGQRDEKL